MLLHILINLSIVACYNTQQFCRDKYRSAYHGDRIFLARSQAVEYSGNGFSFWCYQGGVKVTADIGKEDMPCTGGTVASLDDDKDIGYCKEVGCQCAVMYITPVVGSTSHVYTAPETVTLDEGSILQSCCTLASSFKSN